MITVHHLNNSRSQRILWLLEELGLEYEIKHYQRDPETSRAPQELKVVHPLGKSPVITDGETTVAETGAIIEYILRTYGVGDAADPLQPMILNEIKTHLDYMEYQLIRSDYFAGPELTGADIMMIFPLEAARARGRLKGYEACNDYVNKIHKRPAYIKALERGGAYAYGPQ